MAFSFKKLTADASTAFTRAKQFTEEQLGKAEKTEHDAAFENLGLRSDKTKLWTERILKQTETMLEPNPAARVEEFVSTTLDMKRDRVTNHELLGLYMIEAGNDFGPGTAYGSTLVKCGQMERNIGNAEKEYIHKVNNNFLTPLRTFLEGDMKTIVRERKTLDMKRLDLDAAKSKLKKAKSQEMQTAAEAEVRASQSEFDRQTEVTKLLMEGISSAHANHLRCLMEYAETQMKYFASCHEMMEDLNKDMANASVVSSGNSAYISSAGGVDGASRKARVLYDYDAHESQELSLLADEVITVTADLDDQYVMAKRGNQKGKVPVAYLEYIH
ncbi:PREDICTED: endophilin-B1-like [Priapulus caudatus]|uniref:Endophilin-B1-like n=1 Tax=Priapulus caudatus TaxID=37621 RepID=A0ABM1DVB3_PRICU|nr:PREDICTED: endophilin-B1-like [Priapulus caudatus]